MEKIVYIDGNEVKLKATAGLTRLYRVKFRRDIMQDMYRLKKKYIEFAEKNNISDASKIDQNNINDSVFDIIDLTLFENIAYLMNKYADPQNCPDTPEQWLDQFTMFSIYHILPDIMELWGLNEQTLSESKKNLNRLTGS